MQPDGDHSLLFRLGEFLRRQPHDAVRKRVHDRLEWALYIAQEPGQAMANLQILDGSLAGPVRRRLLALKPWLQPA
eukprot:13262678-Alexandrium_andersonii.AAC.1